MAVRRPRSRGGWGRCAGSGQWRRSTLHKVYRNRERVTKQTRDLRQLDPSGVGEFLGRPPPSPPPPGTPLADLTPLFHCSSHPQYLRLHQAIVLQGPQSGRKLQASMGGGRTGAKHLAVTATRRQQLGNSHGVPVYVHEKWTMTLREQAQMRPCGAIASFAGCQSWLPAAPKVQLKTGMPQCSGIAWPFGRPWGGNCARTVRQGVGCCQVPTAGSAALPRVL